MAINFPNSPATNDTFTSPVGLEYIFDGVKWRSFKPTEPVVGTFNANSAISLSAGGTNQNITLTPSGTGVVTTPASVGIGTTSPSALLTIDGGSITTINYAATPQIRFNYAAGTKSSPAAIASQVPVGAVYGFGYDGTTMRNTSGIFMYSDGAVSSVSSPGFILFATTPSGATTTTERMRITSAGNVGIGTTSPAVKLDVLSDGLILRLLSTTSNSAYLRFDGTGTSFPFLGLIGGIGTFGNTDARPLRFNTNSTERMRIDASGNVGIGTTAPGARLDVVFTGLPLRIANSTTSGYALAQFGQSATATQNWHIGSEGDGTFRWYNGVFGAGTERMRIDASGAIGIGGANYGTSGQTIVSAGSAAAPAWGTLPVAGGGTGVTTSTGTGSVVLSAAPAFTGNTTFNTNTLTIDATNGRVGVGTTTPSFIFDVQQNQNASTTVRVYNSNTSSAGLSTFTTQSDTGTMNIFTASSTYAGGAGMSGIQVTSNTPLNFSTNNAERMRILSSGQLLIGGNAAALTAIPGSLGNSTVYSRVGMTVINDTTTLGYFQSYDSNATTDLKTWRHGGQDNGSYIFQTVNDAYSSFATRLTISTTGILSDGKGDVRAAPIQTKSGAYVVVASDAGQTIYISTGGVTINASILSAGDMITIVNNSASNQTITAGASVTFRLAGTATTGNRTLAQYGMATFLCVVGGATPTFHCSGAGLT